MFSRLSVVEWTFHNRSCSPRARGAPLSQSGKLQVMSCVGCECILGEKPLVPAHTLCWKELEHYGAARWPAQSFDICHVAILSCLVPVSFFRSLRLWLNTKRFGSKMFYLKGQNFPMVPFSTRNGGKKIMHSVSVCQWRDIMAIKFISWTPNLLLVFCYIEIHFVLRLKLLPWSSCGTVCVCVDLCEFRGAV